LTHNRFLFGEDDYKGQNNLPFIQVAQIIMDMYVVEEIKVAIRLQVGLAF